MTRDDSTHIIDPFSHQAVKQQRRVAERTLLGLHKRAKKPLAGGEGGSAAAATTPSGNPFLSAPTVEAAPQVAEVSGGGGGGDGTEAAFRMLLGSEADPSWGVQAAPFDSSGRVGRLCTTRSL